MTAHDPMCWNPQHPHEGICYGNLSRARADERERIANDGLSWVAARERERLLAQVAAAHDASHVGTDSEYELGRRQALRYVLALLGGESDD